MNSQGSITDVSISLPSLSEVLAVLSLQAGYNAAIVVSGAGLLGIAAGVIGAFTLLRKRALMGDALAHSALPGLALAFIISSIFGFAEKNYFWLLLGASLSGIVGVLAVQFLSHYTRLSEDSAIGAVLSVFFGAGIVLLSLIQAMESGSAAGLNHFIYGQTAAMQLADAYTLLVFASCSVLAAALLSKEFTILCFDREFAIVQGWPVLLIDILLMTLLTVVTVVGLQTVGMLLIVSLLIVPAAAARFWTERLSRMVFYSGLIGGLSGYLGAAASALLPRLPAGAVIVLVSGFLFVLSFLFAPERGVLSNFLRLLKLRQRVRRDHLLRELLEHEELREDSRPMGVEAVALRSLRAERLLFRSFWERFFIFRGLLRKEQGRLQLTERGLSIARRITRNHRLWEQYLVEYADVMPSHVDYSADRVEHVLSKEIVEKLEQRLQSRGLQGAALERPDSVHPLRER